MARARILVVDDEESILELVEYNLVKNGYETISTSTGEDAIRLAKAEQPDLVILDLMLPGLDGLEVCKELRAFSFVPIIMVTARVQEIDRLLGLELGADDYICKPFSPREVVARVKTVLRRTREGQSVRAQGLILDENRYRATLYGQELELTAIEFKLLHFLMANPGFIYNRQQLMDKIYPDERIVSDRTIDSHIKKLRKKIAAVSPGEEFIHSVYGIGYKFEVL